MIRCNAIAEVDLAHAPRPRIATLGVFDGLHRAHQRLVRRVVERSRGESGHEGTSIVLTFANHPLSVLAPPYAPRALIAPDRKAQLIEALGVDVLVMPPFTRAFADTPADRFIDEILLKHFGVDGVVAGFDLRFGRNGEGDTEYLRHEGKRRGFDVEILAAIFHDEWPVSSTRVRELIDEGRLRAAAELLGRPYELTGHVVRGYGRGSDLGFATANLVFNPAFAAPPSGVYAVIANIASPDSGDWASSYGGMMNIGSSPTFQGAEYRPEVHLFDFEGGVLYGHRLRVHFLDRLREERRFASARALQERLRADEKMARAIVELAQESDFEQGFS